MLGLGRCRLLEDLVQQIDLQVQEPACSEGDLHLPQAPMQTVAVEPCPVKKQLRTGSPWDIRPVYKRVQHPSVVRRSLGVREW